MKEGDIVLLEMLQSNGEYKLRPALILKKLPKYNDLLTCGISSRLHQEIKNYDEVLHKDEHYFAATGLHKTSLIRLFFLAVITTRDISGGIGIIPTELHKTLLRRLSAFFLS